MKKLNRRDFLKKTALGAAALGMGGLMGKTVFAQTKPPIKIGVAISLTGAMAREGELEVGGYKLWGKIINEKGVPLERWRNWDVQALDFWEDRWSSSSTMTRAIQVRR